MTRWLLAVAALAAPAAASAQALSCAIPSRIERPRIDGPTPSQPRRVLPIGSYTLALTWNPQYCRDNGNRSGANFQCGDTNRFGFTLHGLWPDGEGKTWPQYCRAAAPLPEAVLRQNLCVTPSVQLLQHEYAKHGTCMGIAPAAYFAQARRLYDRVRYPDMDRLSRRTGLTAGQLAAAIARVNPGMTAGMMRITATRQGWLDEVWLCTDKRLRYTTCSTHQGGLAATAPVRIWRGKR